MILRSKGQASTGKNFRSTGDVAINSPADWNRILSARNTFVSKWGANPGFLVYDGKDLVTVPAASSPTTPNPAGYVVKDQELHPDQNGVSQMHMAAFTYWLDPTQTTIRDYVKAYLIAQTSQIWWDFGNTTRWKRKEIGDLPPGYYNAQIICMMVSAMEYIGFDKFDGYQNPSDLTTEFGKIKRWFIDAAIYYAGEIDADLAVLFSPGTVRNGNVSSYVASGTGNQQSTNKRFKGDATLNRSIAKFYNNRRGEMILAVGHVGYAFDHAPSIAAAETFYKEVIAFYCFADKRPGELERSTVTAGIAGAKGWQYIANTYNQISMIAWMDYRKGGTLRHWSTGFGFNESLSLAPRNLASLMAKFCDLRARLDIIYCFDDTDNTNPIRPDLPDRYNGYQDVGFVVACQMFSTADYPVEVPKIRAAAYAFPGPLPSAIGGAAKAVDGNGTYSVHQGPGGTLPGCMFCFGYMDSIPA